MNRSNQVYVLAVLSVCTLISTLFYWKSHGEDLSSSYFGCQVLALGEAQHLYSKDPVFFDRLDDDVWRSLEERTIFKNGGTVHPYVQTPLWAYSIRPLCSSLSYSAFQKLFLLLGTVCFAAFIWIVAKCWTPILFTPAWMVLLAFVFFWSNPVRYALFLVQTHIIFLLMAVLAVLLVKRHPFVAGLLLAVAAAVKITPAYLLIYWLVTRRYKAAFAFAICSGAIVLLTVVTTGWPLYLTYLHNLQETSNVLLVSYNNQSFLAWLLGSTRPPSELSAWVVHPLPTGLKILSTLLALASAAVGGMLDRGSEKGPPYGAVFTIIAATLFVPIAWSHYSFILIVPVMMLIEVQLQRRTLAVSSMLFVLALLLLPPHPITTHRLHLVRPQFYATVLSLAGLVLLRRRSDALAAEVGAEDASLPAAV